MDIWLIIIVKDKKISKIFKWSREYRYIIKENEHDVETNIMAYASYNFFAKVHLEIEIIIVHI
jgi:hypothetical protein